MRCRIELGVIIIVLSLAATVHANWPMLANLQRTSWVPEEVRGHGHMKIDPDWYRPVEPYINPKVQIIAAAGKVYLSTARGRYAFSAEDGAVE